MKKVLVIVFLVLLFGLYSYGITWNPPGFYVDESATAYNAFLVSKTGAGEFGGKFPLFFQECALFNPGYFHPLFIYSLALAFKFLPPSTEIARTVASLWIFSACLLLGVLAARMSKDKMIGVIVGATALLTPWFFESRMAWDPSCLPLAVVVFLLSVYRLLDKEVWSWMDALLVAFALGLITYSYSSGRILAPLFTLGLVLLARGRFLGLFKIWILYALTLVPILWFNVSHPGTLTRRLWNVTYLRPDAPWKDFPKFLSRYFEDLNPSTLIFKGGHIMHHVSAGGVILVGSFVLVSLGACLALLTPWGRFIFYCLLCSIIPGAITFEPFYQLRLCAYPMFLMVLTVPALQWLKDHQYWGIGLLLLAVTAAQAIWFQFIFWRDGPKREAWFEVPFRKLYDEALSRKERPIYLEYNQTHPSYIHAYWYSVASGHNPKENFVRLEQGQRAPRGSLVLSSNSDCTQCEVLRRNNDYMLYTTL